MDFSYAIKDGELIHVSDVDSGLGCGCQCPECGSDLVARKGKIKKHHFAHYQYTACDSESALHKLGKKVVIEKIQQHIKDRKTLGIVCDCSQCNGQHSIDFLKQSTEVIEEYYLGPVIPDIAVFNKKGDVIGVIEIIVTHSPEDEAIQYYKNQNISLLKITLNDSLDLEKIAGSPFLYVESDDLCTLPVCDSCGERMAEKKIYVVEDECWKCNSLMKIAYIDADHLIISPSEFDQNEIKIASSKGALLKKHYSRTMNESYVANTCPGCKAFIGDFHITKYSSFNESEESAVTGYLCNRCY